jgi:osmotically inducible lipoprotein OsmB
MKKRIAIISMYVLIFIPILSSSCADMTPAQEGALVGAGVGGVAGGLIGGSAKATLIGAGVGALGGALLNDEMKKDQK